MVVFGVFPPKFWNNGSKTSWCFWNSWSFRADMLWGFLSEPGYHNQCTFLPFYINPAGAESFLFSISDEYCNALKGPQLIHFAILSNMLYYINSHMRWNKTLFFSFNDPPLSLNSSLNGQNSKNEMKEWIARRDVLSNHFFSWLTTSHVPTHSSLHCIF